MSKVYFIPDVHLQEYSPRSRKDNYPTVVLEKLEYIVNLVNSNNGTCIFMGDIFNAVNMPMIYMYRCIDTFKKFNNTPYTVIGNHDMPRNNQEMMDRSPLGLLEKVGLIKYLDKLELDNKVVIKGFHYGFMPEKIETDLKKICVAHMFYENGFDEVHSLRVKDCLDLGYDYYVLGHDHTRYPVEGNTTYKLFRIGSLTRGSANENQMIRDEVFILEYDTETDIFKEISIPCASAKEIFKDSIFARKEENKIDTKEILDNLVFTNNDSIYDVLDKSEQTDEIKNLVEEYLQAAGIYRNNIL